MIEVVPYNPSHFDEIALQDQQMYLRLKEHSFIRQSLVDMNALTGLHDKKPVAIAGIYRQHGKKGICYCLFSDDCKKTMNTLVRIMRRVIESSEFDRVEMTVDCDFEQGHRLAKILGFEVECPRMRKSNIVGGDETLYVRIK